MLIPGLASVTFRNKTLREICLLCNAASLSAVEWGADVHVPPEKPHIARQVRRMCEDFHLHIPSYGSYYRVTQPIDELRRCMDAAQELGAPMLRIWCGTKGSLMAATERSFIVEQLCLCASEARQRVLHLSLEYHAGTLTDERESVLRLLDETRDFSDSLFFHYQPRFDRSSKECMLRLYDILPRLSHIHAFTWRSNDGKCRLPLESGSDLWSDILRTASVLRTNHCVLLEFVENDSADALLRDAAALNHLIRETAF